MNANQHAAIRTGKWLKLICDNCSMLYLTWDQEKKDILTLNMAIGCVNTPYKDK